MYDPTLPPALPQTGRVPRPGLAKDQTGWLRWLPGLHVLRHYELVWLPHDLMAGLALTAVLVPVGIAYAVASGLPGICGLYATMAGLLAYAMVGPSRILVLGPDSSLAALILAVVLPLSAGYPQRAIALGGMMALVSGVLAVLAGNANPAALANVAGTLSTILLLRRHARLPNVQIAVAGANLVGTLLDLAVRAGVPVPGALQQGLPGFALP
jgi:MFS superfamily sulfate permease-like transporter